MKRILALDGGGIKGLAVAAFLDRISTRDFPDVDSFDMLAGTSTGGIIALGLRMGMSPAEMVNYYRTRGPDIFPRGPKRVHFWQRERYAARGLERSLRDVFGARRLQEISRPVIIPALDWNAPNPQDAVFFFEENSPYSYFSAARATSAAPSYFKGYELDKRLLVDGGICVNNPAQAALAHARELWPEESIQIWSVGTGREPGRKRRYPWTVLPMLNDIFELAIQGGAGVVNKELERDGSVEYIRYDFNLTEAICLDDATPATLDHLMKVAQNPIKRVDTRKRSKV